VAYTDPEVAWVGLTEIEARAQGIEIKKGVFPWMASGRALCLNRSEGMTKIISDARTGRVLGGGIVGRTAGELIGELCLAIEMGCDVEDIALTIHPHPTLCESVGLSAEALLGHCTDLPPAKKQ
jgi:dihydrolipoamide dehydrogenase